MGIIVQKFGGTSVANSEKIKNLARRVVRTHEQGHRVIAVVSAMGDATDQLIFLAHEVSATPPERELDMLLSTGEQVSMALLAIAVSELGAKAISLTGAQVGIVTNRVYRRAKIIRINKERILSELDQGKIVILAGFQGVFDGNEITTLGRGASDTTAVAVAATLGADRCEIYTDVDGVYTADPRVVPNARKLDRITYDEILEMARVGVKVLHPRAIELAKKFNVPLSVRPSFQEGDGTVIESSSREEIDAIEDVADVVNDIILDLDHARITIYNVKNDPGTTAMICQAMTDANINIDMIIQNVMIVQSVNQDGTTDISLTVPEEVLAPTQKVAKSLQEQNECTGFSTDANITKISVAGGVMNYHVGVAARMFNALGKKGINIQMISTSDTSISCVIDSQQTAHTAHAIQAEFTDARFRYGYPSQKDKGTAIKRSSDTIEDVANVVSLVNSDANQARITIYNVKDEPGTAAKICQAMTDANINIDIIIQNTSQDGIANISLTVAKDDLAHAKEVVKGLQEQNECTDFSTDDNITKVSAVGGSMNYHVGVAARMFNALAKKGINIQMVSTSDISISCVIDSQQTKDAACAIHDEFITESLSD